jgi:hypothetical protein
MLHATVVLEKNSRVCILNDPMVIHQVLFDLHDIGYACNIAYASTLAKALDKFWCRSIRQDVNDYCQKCVVCRRAKERSQMAAALDPLP